MHAFLPQVDLGLVPYSAKWTKLQNKKSQDTIPMARIEKAGNPSNDLAKIQMVGKFPCFKSLKWNEYENSTLTNLYAIM